MHTNPVLLSFCSLLYYKNLQIQIKNFIKERKKIEDKINMNIKFSFRIKKFTGRVLVSDAENEALLIKKYKKHILNKWHLLLMLHRNKSLIKYRKFNLIIKQENNLKTTLLINAEYEYEDNRQIIQQIRDMFERENQNEENEDKNNEELKSLKHEIRHNADNINSIEFEATFNHVIEERKTQMKNLNQLVEKAFQSIIDIKILSQLNEVYTMRDKLIKEIVKIAENDNEKYQNLVSSYMIEIAKMAKKHEKSLGDLTYRFNKSKTSNLRNMCSPNAFELLELAGFLKSANFNGNKTKIVKILSEVKYWALEDRKNPIKSLLE